jgi:hypothetical protein
VNLTNFEVGSKHLPPTNVMANPLNVALCPLTALGMYFLHHGLLLLDNEHRVLFPGGALLRFLLPLLMLSPRQGTRRADSRRIWRVNSSRLKALKRSLL